MSESVLERLARVEEKINGITDKVSEHHEYINKTFAKEIIHHRVEMAKMKQDRWWIVTIFGIIFGATTAFVEKVFFK